MVVSHQEKSSSRWKNGRRRTSPMSTQLTSFLNCSGEISGTIGLTSLAIISSTPMAMLVDLSQTHGAKIQESFNCGKMAWPVCPLSMHACETWKQQDSFPIELVKWWQATSASIYNKIGEMVPIISKKLWSTMTFTRTLADGMPLEVWAQEKCSNSIWWSSLKTMTKWAYTSRPGAQNWSVSHSSTFTSLGQWPNRSKKSTRWFLAKTTLTPSPWRSTTLSILRIF